MSAVDYMIGYFLFPSIVVINTQYSGVWISYYCECFRIKIEVFRWIMPWCPLIIINNSIGIKFMRQHFNLILLTSFICQTSALCHSFAKVVACIFACPPWYTCFSPGKVRHKISWTLILSEIFVLHLPRWLNRCTCAFSNMNKFKMFIGFISCLFLFQWNSFLLKNFQIHLH